MEIRFADLTSPNPSSFDAPFNWRFGIESFLPAPMPIDIGIVWVGSAKSSDHDIILDEFEIGGIQPGRNEFNIQHGAPDVLRIPRDELFSPITVMTFTFSIGGQPFARLAYLVQVGAFGPEAESIKAGASQCPAMGGSADSQREAILRVLGRNVNAERPRLTVLEVQDWAGFAKNEQDGSYARPGVAMPKQQPQPQQNSKVNDDNAADANASALSPSPNPRSWSQMLQRQQSSDADAATPKAAMEGKKVQRELLQVAVSDD